MSDVLYLQELYQHGARGNFEVLAAKPYGMWSGPEDRPADATELNFSRVELLREVMVKHGDAGTPVWAVEFGWNALLAGWQGKPSVWGQVDEQTQAMQTVGAIERAQQEWPWMGVMCVRGFEPWAGADDPSYGFSIVDREFQPRAVYRATQALAKQNYAGVGYHFSDDPRFEWLGVWQIGTEQRTGGAGSQLRLAFKGHRLDLLLQPNPQGGKLAATIDGKPANRLQSTNGARVIDLAATNTAPSRITVADGLSDGIHQIELTVLSNPENPGPTKAAIQGVVVAREPLRAPGFLLLTGMAIVGLLCIRWIVVLALRPPSLVAWVEGQWEKLDERAQSALVLVVGGAGIAAACLCADLRVGCLGA